MNLIEENKDESEQKKVSPEPPSKKIKGIIIAAGILNQKNVLIVENIDFADFPINKEVTIEW